jgi:hypothetical protein
MYLLLLLVALPLVLPVLAENGLPSTSTPVIYAFTPFPTPTEQAIPGVFPATDPQNPPPVSTVYLFLSSSDFPTLA